MKKKDEKSMGDFKIKIQSQEERAILDLETVQTGEEGTVFAPSVPQGYGTSDIPYLGNATWSNLLCHHNYRGYIN